MSSDVPIARISGAPDEVLDAGTRERLGRAEALMGFPPNDAPVLARNPGLSPGRCLPLLLAAATALASCTADTREPAPSTPAAAESTPPLFVLRNDLIDYAQPLASWGVAVSDADGDGDMDVWLTQHGGTGSAILVNRLNEGASRLETVKIEAPGDQHGATWGDLDRDGKPEVLVLRGGGRGGLVSKPMDELGNQILARIDRNAAPLDFRLEDNGDSESDFRGLYYSLGRGRTPTLLDADHDGRLDVFIGNQARADGEFPSALFYQQPDCTFVRQAEKLGISGNSFDLAIPADFDLDGQLDLFLRGERSRNAIVHGHQDGFRPPTVAPPPKLVNTASQDVVVADFNGDLRPDVWLITMKRKNGKGGVDRLLLNTASGFVDVSNRSGVAGHAFNSRNATSGDFDNDGDIDVYVINSNHYANVATENLPNVLWENVGNAGTKGSTEVPSFVPRSGPGYAPGSDNGLGMSVASGDFNSDGRLDLLVANGAKDGRTYPQFFSRGTYDFYLGNASQDKAWLLVELVGTTSNIEGIGAVVHATAAGVTQLRTADHGMHARTQDDPRLHFGFGPLDAKDRIRLEIQWPSGERQVLEGVEPRQVLRVVEPEARDRAAPAGCGPESLGVRPRDSMVGSGG